MGVKSKIKGIVGEKNVQKLQVLKAKLNYLKSNRPGHPPRFSLQSNKWQEPVIFSLPDKHVFFGYYDIQQLNRQQNKLLVTIIPRNADTGRDKATLQWIDLKTGEYHAIGTTNAWCWQQGARLRWHPTMDDVVLYNDVENDHYVTRSYDLKEQKEIEVFSRALYDISPDFRYGLSLNYSRLQRLRPGYGYNTLPDKTETDKVPVEDGIFLVNLKDNTTKCIISYEELVARTPAARDEWNYINHISISPDGSRFIFFHLYTPGVGAHWKTKLYTAKLDGTELQCLEQEYVTSHYCWKNNNELLTTSVGFDGARSYYISYDIESGSKGIIESEYLTHDGHPTYLSDGKHFVADTYPLKNCMQHLFISSINGEYFEPICSIYSDPRMFKEKRCDLHPRITPDGKYLTIDTTCKDGKRSVWLFENKKGKLDFDNL